MKGKAAGKGRASERSSSQTDDATLDHGFSSLSKGEHNSVYEPANVCPKMLMQVGNELSGLKSGGQMTSQARVFVHDCTLSLHSP